MSKTQPAAKNQLAPTAKDGQQTTPFRVIENAIQDCNWTLAISILEDHCRKSADQEALQKLIDVRIQAFKDQEWPRPHIDWPPPYDPDIEAKVGFPDINMTDLSTSALRSGIIGRGAIIVRNLMPGSTVDTLKQNIDRAFHDRLEERDNQGAYTGTQWYSRSDEIKASGPTGFARKTSGKAISNYGSIWAAHSPANAEFLIQFYKSIGLDRMLDSYFDEPTVLSVRKWVLRHVAPSPKKGIGWHQDGQFLGDGIRTVNLWIALTECGAGTKSPGLDLVTGNKRSIYEVGTKGANADWTVGPGLVEEIAKKNPIVSPHFQPGDAIFFDHFSLHKTGYRLDSTRDRYAVESWFYGASTAPMKQIPLVLS